jgi:hypothetical protein
VVLGEVFLLITVRTNYIWDVDHVELVNQGVVKATGDVTLALATV